MINSKPTPWGCKPRSSSWLKKVSQLRRPRVGQMPGQDLAASRVRPDAQSDQQTALAAALTGSWRPLARSRRHLPWCTVACNDMGVQLQERRRRAFVSARGQGLESTQVLEQGALARARPCSRGRVSLALRGSSHARRPNAESGSLLRRRCADRAATDIRPDRGRRRRLRRADETVASGSGTPPQRANSCRSRLPLRRKRSTDGVHTWHRHASVRRRQGMWPRRTYSARPNTCLVCGGTNRVSISWPSCAHRWRPVSRRWRLLAKYDR